MEHSGMTRVYVSLPAMKEYKNVVVLTHPGVLYVNTCAAEGAKMTLIVRELAA